MLFDFTEAFTDELEKLAISIGVKQMRVLAKPYDYQPQDDFSKKSRGDVKRLREDTALDEDEFGVNVKAKNKFDKWYDEPVAK